MPFPWLSLDDARVRLRTEQVLATARVILAAGGLGATYLDPTDPVTHAPLVYSLLVIYLFVSIPIALIVRRLSGIGIWVARGIVVVDLIFAALLTLFTAGTSSPLFAYFWFVLLSGAFRYGFGGAIGAALVLIIVMVLQLSLRSFVDTTADLELNFVIVRATYLGVMAFLLGYLTQKEHDLRTEAIVVARTLAEARDNRSFSQGIRNAARQIRSVFKVRSGVLAFEAVDGSRQCWYWTHAGEERATIRSLAMNERQSAYFFAFPGDVHVWSAAKDTPHAGSALAFSGERATIPQPPAELWQALEVDRIVAVCTPLSDGSTARVYLLNSDPVWSARQLHLLHVIALTLAPALHNLLLLEVEAGSSERSRIARELHDRVVQSLIGVDLQLAALQKSGVDTDRLMDSVRSVHQTVRDEVENIRELMHELRPLEVPSAQLSMHLKTLVERFQRDTGIQAVYRPDPTNIALSSQRCGDLVRLVQEALMNVRKHSGATHVSVELTPDREGVMLSITDDGRGFQFEGRLNDQQLWLEQRGPRIIQERARAIGGSLAIESRPGLGARLELFIPYAI